MIVYVVMRYTATMRDGHRYQTSEAREIDAKCAADIEREAAAMLAGCPDDRAFVTHHALEGRAFPGYRKMRREFHGRGFEAPVVRVMSVEDRLAESAM